MIEKEHVKYSCESNEHKISGLFILFFSSRWIEHILSNQNANYRKGQCKFNVGYVQDFFLEETQIEQYSCIYITRQM